MSTPQAGPTTQPLDPRDLRVLLVAVVAFMVAGWSLPAAVTLVHSHSLPDMAMTEAAIGTLRVGGHLRDPRRAYTARARDEMPAGASWWLAALAPALGAGVVAGKGWRRLAPRVASSKLGRRVYDPEGSRTEPWARKRHVPELVVPRRDPDRLTIGTVGGKLVAGRCEDHAIVVAPTGSGKTTSCVIPWVLEATGPVVVTSTFRDVFDATVAHRRRLGRVYVWDPGADDCMGWTPVDGCADWGTALRQADWLADAVGDGDHAGARYWNGEAAKLIATLLHAAALADEPIGTVITWLDAQNVEKPMDILETEGATAAMHQLASIAGLDSRNRSTTYQTAGSLLKAYRHPDVLKSAYPDFRAAEFLDGGAHTLYICAPADRQKAFAPLIVAIISSLFAAAAENPERGSKLRMILDELPNIAPLRDIDAHASQVRKHDITLALIAQTVSQLHARYGENADTIVGNCATKVFMGPITDDKTRRYLTDTLGHTADDDAPGGRRPNATARDLQQLNPRDNRAILIAGSSIPTMVRLRPYYEDEARLLCMRRLARGRLTRAGERDMLNTTTSSSLRKAP